MSLDNFLDTIGFSRYKINFKDNLISTIGGFIGIFGIFLTSLWLLDPEFSVLIVPSMGASAVLLFAAPHAPFSQPWNLVAGHAISAIIGVACWQWIPNEIVAASSSVGLSIGAMYITRSIHPPGGATALAAVIGSEKLHQLGYSYEYAPVLLNVVTLLLIAIAFNYIFKWRRYPANLESSTAIKEIEKASEIEIYPPIKHEDFVYALSHIDTFVDITEKDLLKIYKLATSRHVEAHK